MTSLCTQSCYFNEHHHPPHLHSFPTRRSSDLAGELVELLGDRLFLDEVDEAHDALDVREDRVGIRVPAEDHLVLPHAVPRSEEHTSELQSQSNIVCRLLLEKKKNKQ